MKIVIFAIAMLMAITCAQGAPPCPGTPEGTWWVTEIANLGFATVVVDRYFLVINCPMKPIPPNSNQVVMLTGSLKGQPVTIIWNVDVNEIWVDSSAGTLFGPIHACAGPFGLSAQCVSETIDRSGISITKLAERFIL